jgi:ribosomal RNA-processing protein 1
MGKKSNGKGHKEPHVVEALNDPKHDGDSKFARALGSGEFHTRDLGLKAVSKWLQSQPAVDEGSLLKLWKGLLFCFWHSDKAPVQQDLAQRLAAILMVVNDQVRLLCET